jgi:hypothetical protein
VQYFFADGSGQTVEFFNTNQLRIVSGYAVTLNIQKDGSAFMTHSKTFTLR